MTSQPVPLYRGYAFDLDGTIYLGDELIPGAADVVRRLREQGSQVVFVTNKPIESNDDYVRKLTRLGIEADASNVISATDALLLYLRQNAAGARILPVAEHVVIDALTNAGFEVVHDPDLADVVVVSFDRTFDYDKLYRAYRAVGRGARIVATNPDPYCPTPYGGLPDCAAMLAAIEACTGAKAEAIVGKPSKHMATAFLSRLGVPASSALMVGDRLLTDVAMGLESGMDSALVLSGATTFEQIAPSGIVPTHVIDDVNALVASAA
jgi:NagD protein